MVRFFGLLGVLCVFAEPASATTPELNTIMPRGGQRGTEVILQMTGARLGDCKEVVFYQPGLNVAKLEVVNPNQLKVTVKIAGDCPLGEHAIRLRGPGGTSSVRTFWVGALPVVDEKEPNNEFAHPQPIPLNCTVHGLITPEDVDYFVVEATKGQRLSVEIEGMRLGTAFFDPAIAVLNEKRFELATCDDTPLLGQDGCLSILVPVDGKYVIRVRESAYGGSGASFYRLHVGTFPRPMAVYPAGGRPGEEIEATLIGDPFGNVKRKVKLPATLGRFSYHFDDPEGITPSAFPMRVVDIPNVMEVEPNDSPKQATPAVVPGAFNGIIDKPGDQDYFKFTAKKGQTFDIRCHARRIGSPLDPVMWVGYADGRIIAANDDAEGQLDSYLRFTAPGDKEYVIGVRDHLHKGGPLFVYRVEVRPIEPKLNVSLIRYGIPPTQERQTIDVPRGNRFAVVVNAQRADWGGEVELGMSDAPTGLTMRADKVPAGLAAVPVVFEAKDDAAIGGSLGLLTAKPVDPKNKITGKFGMLADLVIGPNNREYAKISMDKLPFAVTEPAPFSIRIVEPKNAVVRNGTIQLKIVAERRDGHKAAIGVQTIFNPPGVAANNIAIPEGKTEGVMTLTANGGAAIGKWNYVVIGQSSGPHGPVTVSSQMAYIEVAAPPLTVAFERATTEQGKPVTLKAKVNVNHSFPGSAKLKLVGLPNKVTANEVDVTAQTKELSFAVTTDPISPAGHHRNLYCVATLTLNGEAVVYTAGVAELRINKPLPPKAGPQPGSPKGKGTKS